MNAIAQSLFAPARNVSAFRSEFADENCRPNVRRERRSFGILSAQARAVGAVTEKIHTVIPRNKYTHHVVCFGIIGAGFALQSFVTCHCHTMPETLAPVAEWLPDVLKEMGAASYIEAGARLWKWGAKEVEAAE